MCNHSDIRELRSPKSSEDKGESGTSIASTVGVVGRARAGAAFTGGETARCEV